MARRIANLEKIVEIGLQQAAADGFEAVSLIHIARELGIKSPSLFNHVKGLQDLRGHLRAAAQKSLGDALALSLQMKAGPEALDALAGAYRLWARENPGLYPAVFSAPPAGQPPHHPYHRLIQTMGLVFSRSPYSQEERDHHLRALRSMLHGWAMLEISGSLSADLDLDWSFRQMTALLAERAFEKR